MSQELLTTGWTAPNVGTVTYGSDGITMVNSTTASQWIYSDYIPLPQGTGMTYESDFDISVSANNQVYIQIERFNASKGSISNNAADTPVSYKPSSNTSHVRYKSTRNISTFDSPAQQTAFIRIRMCSGYQATIGTMVIHNYSLRAIPSSNNQHVSITKQGQALCDHLREHNNNAAFGKDGFIYGNNLYEY